MSQFPILDLSTLAPPQGVVALVPSEIARRNMCVPVHKRDSTLIVAMADPSDLFALDELRFATGLFIEPARAEEADLRAALDRLYPTDGLPPTNQRPLADAEITEDMSASTTREDKKKHGDFPLYSDERHRDADQIIRLNRIILLEASRRGASRIQFDARTDEGHTHFTVRLIIDGESDEFMRPPTRIVYVMLKRFQFMARIFWENGDSGIIRIHDDERGVWITSRLTIPPATPEHRSWTIDLS